MNSYIFALFIIYLQCISPCLAENIVIYERESFNSGWVANKYSNKVKNYVLLKRSTNLDGRKSLLIDAIKPTRNSVSWVSRIIKIKRGGYLYSDVTVSMKSVLNGVKIWHKMAVTIQYFDRNGKYIKNDDIVRASGTKTYVKYNSTSLVPSNATHIKILFSIIGTTGKALLHRIKIQQYFPATTYENKYSIYPRPWKIKCDNSRYKFKKIYIQSESNRNIEKDHINNIKKIIVERYGHGIITDVYSSDVLTINFILVTRKNGHEKHRIEYVKPDGYSLQSYANAKKVKIKSSTIRGLVYGLHTLGQLTKSRNGHFQLSECTVRDWPVISIRGSAGGTSSRKLIKLLSRYKINEYHLSAAPGLWKEWSKPTTYKDKKAIFNIAKSFQNYYVDAAVMIWPGAYGKIFVWNDRRDREKLEAKAKLYLKYGFHSIVLVLAHDYERLGRDIYSNNKKVKDKKFVLQHYLFVKKFYRSLYEYMSSGKRLIIFPYYYMGANNLSGIEVTYLRNMGKLNSAIDIIYGGPADDKNANKLETWIKRKPILRISTPGSVGQVKIRDGRYVLRYLERLHSNLRAESLSSINIELPYDHNLIKYIADFMWNYGR